MMLARLAAFPFLLLAGLALALGPAAAPSSTAEPGETPGTAPAKPLPVPVVAPPMEKVLTPEANFVVWVPVGWKVGESATRGYRTALAQDPTGQYEVAMSYGLNPEADTASLARRLLAEISAKGRDLALTECRRTDNWNPLVLNARYTDAARGPRELRLWVAAGQGQFYASRIEAPLGKLAEKRDLLLLVLVNFRATKGSYEYAGGAPTVPEFQTYRMRDGSASFLLPQGWGVLELGGTFFIAQDPTRAWSFMSANVQVLAPMMALYVPTALAGPYQRPSEAMKWLLVRQGHATEVTLLEVTPLEDLQKQMALVYTAGPVLVENFLYKAKMKQGPAKGFTFGISFGSRIGGQWSLRHLTVLGPEDQFDGFGLAFAEMLQSYAINDRWAKEYVARGMERLKQLQAQTSALIARNAAEIRQMNTAAFQERMRSGDYIDWKRSQTMLGQSSWVTSMEGGTVYESNTWGLQNKTTGEYVGEGPPFTYPHFGTGGGTYGSMIEINDRQKYEQFIRGQ